MNSSSGPVDAGALSIWFRDGAPVAALQTTGDGFVWCQVGSDENLLDRIRRAALKWGASTGEGASWASDSHQHIWWLRVVMEVQPAHEREDFWAEDAERLAG